MKSFMQFSKVKRPCCCIAESLNFEDFDEQNSERLIKDVMTKLKNCILLFEDFIPFPFVFPSLIIFLLGKRTKGSCVFWALIQVEGQDFWLYEKGMSNLRIPINPSEVDNTKVVCDCSSSNRNFDLSSTTLRKRSSSSTCGTST